MVVLFLCESGVSYSLAGGPHSLIGLVAVIPLLTSWLFFPLWSGDSHSLAGGSCSLAGAVVLILC